MTNALRLAGAGVICLYALTTPLQAATPIGKVFAKSGSPSASGPGGNRALAAGAPIYEDDRIVTGGGNVQIIFVDDTKLVVGPNSTLVIDRFLMRGGSRAQKFSVAALRGTFRFISGRSAKNAYDIQTANATIGIRGTAFDFSSGRATLVAVHAGRVRLCAYGQCESVDDRCGVGRAADNDVDELGGKAKGRAVRSLPYILNQGPLAQPFRVNTSSCRSVATLFQNFFGGGSQGGNGPGSGGAERGSPPDNSGPPNEGS
ncbi:FecR family protein [Taklimakanibacter lacteus]|uniref:FecR family protein n=1 Tax=Taklimakanibacter lacteus TaxID=2268456 RepID=UPI0013C52873